MNFKFKLYEKKILWNMIFSSSLVAIWCFVYTVSLASGAYDRPFYVGLIMIAGICLYNVFEMIDFQRFHEEKLTEITKEEE